MVLFNVSRDAMEDLKQKCEKGGINIIYIDSTKEIDDEIKNTNFDFVLKKPDLV